MSTNGIRSETRNGTLGSARIMAHNAAQLAALSALANLAAQPDYSHTALTWDAASGGFQTGTFDSFDGPVFIRVTLSPLAMWLVRGGETVDMIALEDTSEDDCLVWLDNGLMDRGLNPASGVAHPFKLPEEVDAISHFETKDLGPELQTLARWYDLANHQLLAFSARHGDLDPGPGPVHCWPHHFDIASYVSLENGSQAAARGIGVGMSPGDGAYSEPYIYVNPWPHPSTDRLPSAPTPGHWHTDDFVGAVATAGELSTLKDLDTGVAGFLEDAFSAGRDMLNA